MSYDRILERVGQYYSEKIQTHGATARGVDWNSPESQALRFRQLLKVAEREAPFSINDYGCGYGALADYLRDENYAFAYRGFDISPQMVSKAEELHGGAEQVVFFSEEAQLTEADYTVASGIFNVKLQVAEAEWEKYVLSTIEKISNLSRQGFAFNVLTKYSDKEFMRPDLYYADPLFLFDLCKTRYSRFVSLLHDYPLYEFTVLVKKG
jgi:predicted TPR repeat methyltransferase